MKYLSAFLTASFLLATLSGCGTNNEEPIVKEINDISISPSSASIYATTNQLELKASVNYSDATSADITEAARWETDFAAASLSYGKLTPKINGDENGSDITVSVTASYRGIEDTTSVTIYALQDLNISDDTNGSPTINTEYTFTAIASYSNGDSNITIGTGNSNNVSWDVNDTNIAEIISQTDGIAKIKFLQSGDVNITVKAYDISFSDTYSPN